MHDTSENPVKYSAKPIAPGSQTARRLAARAIPFDRYSRGATPIEPGNPALRSLISGSPAVIDQAVALTTTSRAEDVTTRSHEFPLGSRTLTFEGLPSRITALLTGTDVPSVAGLTRGNSGRITPTCRVKSSRPGLLHGYNNSDLTGVPQIRSIPRATTCR